MICNRSAFYVEDNCTICSCVSYLVVVVVSVCVCVWCRYEGRSENRKRQQGSEFDFVDVGGFCSELDQEEMCFYVFDD